MSYDVYEIKTSTSEECRLGDRYYLSLFLGALKIQKVGIISLMSIFGFEFYHRIDDRSVLLGVNWNV